MLLPMIIVGGMSERPTVIGGRIAVRRIVDLTVTIDHDVVDGAPAARFIACSHQVADLLSG